MESYFQEIEVNFESPSSSRSSESDDSQRLVIVEEFEDLEEPQTDGSVRSSTGGRSTYEAYKKICIKDHLLTRLTYNKLKRLMALYHTEIAGKSKCNSLTSWKTAKLMSRTLIMFHLMFEEIEEDITLNSIYYQQMSDLISIYVDFEIKASEVSAESVYSLASRIISIMENCLDHQHRFTLDTILKSHNICKKFQEISTLLISRVVRDLPTTEYSEQSFIRSMLVFKLWIQISKNVEERTNILKLASHLARPPKELMKEPSKLAKEILPSNFHKCYIDLATYIIGTPWPLHKKIKIFLERTKILETHIPKITIKSSDNTEEEPINEEMADIKVLRQIQSGLQKMILLEKKNKEIIRTLKSKHYKCGSVEELEKAPQSLEYVEICKKDTSTQTFSEQIGELPFSHSKAIHECINELYKRITESTNMEPVQNQGREENTSQNNEITTEISITDEPPNTRNAEFPEVSIPKEVTNSLNFDFNPAERKKTIKSVNDPYANIQNNDIAISGFCRKGKENNNHLNTEDERGSSISVRPAAIISNHLKNVSTTAVADWHTPEIHCQSKGSFPSYRLPMTSGMMNKGVNQINQTISEIPSMTSTLPLPKETSIIINEQPNPYTDLVRSSDSLLPTNSSLPYSPDNHHSEPNLINGPPRTLLNRRAIMRSSNTGPDCREDNLIVRDTTIKYYPPGSKNNANIGPFNHVQGTNSVGFIKDRNHPLHQSYPVLFNPYRRPHYSQANGSFSFYDNDTIANSRPQITGSQDECRNLTDSHSLMTNYVQPQHPLPFNVPPGSNDEPTPQGNQAGGRRGRGRKYNSAMQRCHGKQSSATPANIVGNTYPTSDNRTMPNWPNIIPQERNYSFRTADCNYIPNSGLQVMLKPPAPIPNIITNDPKCASNPLPPYSSIRRKNNGFDPALPNIVSLANSYSGNSTPNCFPANNTPLAISVTNTQPFSPVNNNSVSLPNIDTPSSVPTTNVSLSKPPTIASTSSSVPKMPETNSEVLRSSNYYNTFAKDPILNKIKVYQKILNIALDKALSELTHKNDYGFLEYKLQKMPIPLQAFKDALIYIEKLNETDNSTDTIDRIITLLSQSNENFVNEKNMFPPHLLKVNNIDMIKDDINIPLEQRKRHEGTLNNDQLAFVYQEKVNKFYSEFNNLSQEGVLVKLDIQNRCYCLQCCANKIVLDVNHMILKYFRNYQISHSSSHSNDNEKNQSLKMTAISKRSLEKNIEERDSPLPLKKRITSTPPNEARLIKGSEISYPSTPMISIAELELLKDISSTAIQPKTVSVNIIPSSMEASHLSDISENVLTNKTFPVPEPAASHILENNESNIMSANNNNCSNALLHVNTHQNLASSQLNQSSVPLQPNELKVTNATKKSIGRPRKNAKKDGQK